MIIEASFSSTYIIFLTSTYFCIGFLFTTKHNVIDVTRLNIMNGPENLLFKRQEMILIFLYNKVLNC